MSHWRLVTLIGGIFIGAGTSCRGTDGGLAAGGGARDRLRFATVMGMILTLAVAGCAGPAERPAASIALVSPALVRDDGEREALRDAVEASIRYWHKQKSDREIEACGTKYRAADFLATLNRFAEIVENTAPGELEASIAREFTLCQPADLLVTGYYQPRLKASLVKKPPFVYPLYRVPDDLIQARKFDPHGGEEPMAGRIDRGRLVPYWSRAEIETKDLLRGNELCFLADPVDLFFLQVQGSGVVEFPDGSIRQLLFAGTNGRPYRSIGRLLADEGKIPLDEVDMLRIRRYLDEHLDERQRILHYNERYVFFRLAEVGPGLGPVGSMGAVLTPERSVALDEAVYPMGGLYYLQTERPVCPTGGVLQLAWQPLRRFVLQQDSGAAINGPGRLDFFWGSGDFPELAAGLMKRPGRLSLVMLKDRDVSRSKGGPGSERR